MVHPNEVPATFTAATLLDPPSHNQQRLLELIAQAFVGSGWQWPLFDYIEGELDMNGIDAWTELESLPRHPSGGYAAAWWPRAPNVKPVPDATVGLTVLGLHHTEAAQHARTKMVPAFFALLNLMAEWRRNVPRAATKTRKLDIASDEVINELTSRGFRVDLIPPKLLWDLLDHEPPTWGAGGSITEDGGWTRGVPREVYRFEGVETIETYIEWVLAMLIRPAPPAQMAMPSPLGLVAAIDYLDTVWRLVPEHSGHLFQVHGAQRTALLAFAAETADEFDSRLSSLGEILRSFQLPPEDVPKARRERGKPLASLQTYLLRRLPESRARIERAITTLTNILDVRDAGQHTAAGKRGATALAALGVGYPPPSWSFGWNVVRAHTIEALDAIREELATLTS